MVKLTENQIEEIYLHHMMHDFPDNERKPLKMILKALHKGNYECYGAEIGGKLCGYAFFVKDPLGYLLDYFAVFPEMRSKGIGSSFLRELADRFEKEHVLIEVENPLYASTPEERETRLRRISFYLQNGCQDTDISTKLFKVEYRLLLLSDRTHLDQDKIKEAYRSIYRHMLPLYMYRTMFKIH